MKHSSMDSRRDMPEHLLFDILLWLPVTSLLRFKAVCKSWYTLIDSSIFISQHFDHNSGKDNLLGRLDTASGKYPKFCLSGNKYEVYSNFDCGQHCPDSAETMLSFSSNGILCFIDYERNISLWNPSMKQWRSLSIPLNHWQCYYESFFGFGFNVKRNDYNIVITTSCSVNTSSNLVNVYSLKADSWITMRNDFAIPSRFYGLHTCHITKDGTCFWIAYSDSDDADGIVILSFELNDERYETMPLPVGKVSSTAVIDFLGDKLAYIHCSDRHRNMNYYIEIWVLDEYGVKESWNKAWKIGPINVFFFPLHFSSNGEFLLFTDGYFSKNYGRFRLYSLSTEEDEYNELHRPNLGFSSIVRYTESLFPVKRANDAH